jgi:spermidine synthase
MAAGYKHPKVKVHVGDGFKFLDDYKNTFDVIITDSSDPDGPAESLFQKPYFQLMHDALREGGVITTQGCRFSLILDCQNRALGMTLGSAFQHAGQRAIFVTPGRLSRRFFFIPTLP